MEGVTFAQFLAWITGPDAGGFVLVTTFAAVFLEDLGWWKALASRLKWVIFLALSAALGVGAVLLQAHPETVALIDPYFRPFAYSVLLWLTSQGIHEAGKLAARLSPKA